MFKISSSLKRFQTEINLSSFKNSDFVISSRSNWIYRVFIELTRCKYWTNATILLKSFYNSVISNSSSMKLWLEFNSSSKLPITAATGNKYWHFLWYFSELYRKSLFFTLFLMNSVGGKNLALEGERFLCENPLLKPQT